MSADRALRAEQLADAPIRGHVARTLRELVAAAERERRQQLASAVPVCRTPVAAWADGLLGLAEALERPGAVNPCGVARALALVNDTSGPLYSPAPERSLGARIWWVADGLQPCPPHAWASPVIMKIDPEHVAWTCRRCGAIAVTDDVAARPA